MHEIKSGDDAKAKPIQDNFDELVSNMTKISEQFQSLSSSIASQLKTVTSSFDTKLEKIYKVGSLFLTTESSCPLAEIFGEWELVASGKALWTGNGSNGNTTIAAKLPQLYGQIGITASRQYSGDGVFKQSYTKDYRHQAAEPNQGTRIVFNANAANSMYQDGATVQPPAYVVNVFRRIA